MQKVDLTCPNPVNCAHFQCGQPADWKECMVWKLEKQINQVKYSNNVSFPKARKIARTKSYSQVTMSKIVTKQNHSYHSCSTILEKLVDLMPLSHDRIFASVRRRMGTRRIS